MQIALLEYPEEEMIITLDLHGDYVALLLGILRAARKQYPDSPNRLLEMVEAAVVAANLGADQTACNAVVRAAVDWKNAPGELRFEWDHALFKAVAKLEGSNDGDYKNGERLLK